jgi:hypothetical protein
MPDAVVFPAIGLIAAGVIALALVWPQGEGAPSPAPFGRPLAPISQPAPAPVAGAPGRRPVPPTQTASSLERGRAAPFVAARAARRSRADDGRL